MKGLLVDERWLGHTATEGERAELHTCERVRKGPPIKRRTLPTGLERQGTRNIKTIYMRSTGEYSPTKTRMLNQARRVCIQHKW